MPSRFVYTVTFNQPGCLPDDEETPTFDTLREAREYIEQEWEALAGDDPAWNDDAGNGTPAYRDALAAIAGMEPGSHADSPTVGSLYRWHLAVALRCPECGDAIWDTPHGHHLAKCWNSEAHASGDTLAFDTMGADDE